MKNDKVQYLVVKPYSVGDQYEEDRESIRLYETTHDRLGDEIRKHVGGYFDVAQGMIGCSIFVHDEGLLIGLDGNGLATALHAYGHYLAGPAVIAGGVDNEGNTLSVPTEVLAEIHAIFPHHDLSTPCHA